MAHLAIRLLGPFRVTLDGESITGFESDRVHALLATLAVEADRPQRREKLVGLLWPDWPERSARYPVPGRLEVGENGLVCPLATSG
jgi:DNA-binding SARP family transcriptional activator